MTDDATGSPGSPERTSADEDEASENVEVRVVDKRWWAKNNDQVDDEPRSSKPTYVQELEQQLADKDGLLTSYASKYKAAAAEFEESRVRLRREIKKDMEREKRRVLASFLDVIDNLDRAVGAARDASADSTLLNGVEMVRQQFLGILEGHGVSPIDAVGMAFDPTEHDAISTTAVDSSGQHDTIVEIVKLGYRVGEEILRPASVVVGRHAPVETGTGPPNED